jgi:capsid protein
VWQWPGWPALDPYREAAADVILARAAIRSRDEIVSSRGRDVAEVNSEIENDPLLAMVMSASPRVGTAGTRPSTTEVAQ